MSKKLKKLLEKFGVQNVDEVIKKINADDDAEEIIDELLASAQTYSEPFIRTKVKTEFDTERKTLKGKYFQDAARKVNKIFGNKLSNKELEDILNDPENEGKTFDAVVEDIKEKTADKGGKSETELQKMLDASNGKVSDLETQLNDAKAKYEKDLAAGISKVKLDSVLRKKLTELLPKFTNMNPIKAADLIIDKISQKASLKLTDKDEISLHDISDPEKPLKKNETQLQNFEGLISDLAKEYELPVAKSPEGNKKRATGSDDDDHGDKNDKIPGGVKSASGLAAAFAQATTS